MSIGEYKILARRPQKSRYFLNKKVPKKDKSRSYSKTSAIFYFIGYWSIKSKRPKNRNKIDYQINTLTDIKTSTNYALRTDKTNKGNILKIFNSFSFHVFSFLN